MRQGIHPWRRRDSVPSKAAFSVNSPEDGARPGKLPILPFHGICDCGGQVEEMFTVHRSHSIWCHSLQVLWLGASVRTSPVTQSIYRKSGHRQNGSQDRE
jgi:hypothetical protein